MRVWNIDPTVVAENGGFGVQVAELVGHSFGIPVVAFAPYSSLLVSVGNQHDMDINVWNWRVSLVPLLPLYLYNMYIHWMLATVFTVQNFLHQLR